VSAVEQNLRFPGQYFDIEINASYNYFRTYDASTGRYTQSDPIGLRGGLNTYAYAGDNSVKYVDPYGLYFNYCIGFGCSYWARAQAPGPKSSAHRNRNRFNKCPVYEPISTSKFPFGLAQDCNGNRWQKDPWGAAAWHGGLQGNSSYRRDNDASPNGGFQCVYKPNGTLLLQGPYRGTYDYVAPSVVPWTIGLHRIQDVTSNHEFDNNSYSNPDLTKQESCECK